MKVHYQHLLCLLLPAYVASSSSLFELLAVSNQPQGALLQCFHCSSSSLSALLAGGKKKSMAVSTTAHLCTSHTYFECLVRLHCQTQQN